jgi:hypothetical protein
LTQTTKQAENKETKMTTKSDLITIQYTSEFGNIDIKAWQIRNKVIVAVFEMGLPETFATSFPNLHIINRSAAIVGLNGKMDKNFEAFINRQEVLDIL